MNVAHAGFILASYLLCLGVILGMIGAIWLDHRRLKRDLAKLGGLTRATDSDP